MSSPQLPTTIFAPDAPAALTAAVADVAERSFFACAEPCEAGRFAELVEGTMRWYSVTVEFEARSCAGAVRCLVPEELAATMFEALSAPNAGDAETASADVADLLREFANMVCGAWLMRAAGQHRFDLRTLPVSVSAACAPVAGESWTTLAFNNRPVAVAVRIAMPALAGA
jgi:hypothetical protein